MAQIKISADTLSCKAKMLKENVEIIKKSLYEINKINNELKEGWTGGKNVYFQEKLNHYEQMTMDELTVLCDQFSNYIEEVVDAYRNTEEQLLNTFFGEE